MSTTKPTQQDKINTMANVYRPGRTLPPVQGSNPITAFLLQGKSNTQRVISSEVFPGEPRLIASTAGNSRLFQVHRRPPLSLPEEHSALTEVVKPGKRKALTQATVSLDVPIPELLLTDVAYTFNSRVSNTDGPRQGIVGFLQMTAYQADLLLKDVGDSLQIGDYLTYFPTPMQPASFITCEVFGINLENKPWETYDLAYTLGVIKESGTQIQSLEDHLESFKALTFEEVTNITPNIFG